MTRTPSRSTLLGSLLVAVGSFLPSITRPPWEPERLTEWAGPAGHVGLFFYDYLVLGVLLLTVAAFRYAESDAGGRKALLAGGLSIVAARGWFVWEEFFHDCVHSGFTLGVGVYLSVLGAVLLVAAGVRGLAAAEGASGTETY
ncbi:hypothetical protein M0R88_08755 [Halorussus gelatinilyticus]|uniref:Uncharacterized protein n=1 Tax=Halorussus gelatinilyticus TaxID=2937524 RepID=A0A8U0IQ85_9EURY|nr:hypothetical protein [Halorussus gelatinilyticus]UPW02169.1 hypothetical protein M0R88_08755 [Halorussus gelatinilyticus]